MIRIAIVEDDEADARTLSGFISAWAGAEGAEAVSCQVYADAVSFLERECAAADIVFMDIEMPYMSGMDAAAEFRKRNRNAVLIFATRATKYAVRGYSVDAAGYLVKPIREKDFAQVFEKAVRLCREQMRRQTVMLRTKEGVVKMCAEQIHSIEAASHMLNIDAGDRVYRIWGKMDQILEQLPEEFVCCHRSYIVNLKYVDSVTRDGLYLVGAPKALIPVSRSKRQEFLEKLTGYYARTMRR